MEEQPPDDLISARKAARILGVHFGTLYRWIRRGRLRSWNAFELVRVSEAEVRGVLKRKPVKRAPAKVYSAKARAARDRFTAEVLERAGY